MGTVITGFLAKFFSTEAIASRLMRAILLAFGAIQILGHIPHNTGEWSAVIAAFMGGLIGAGQNQSALATPTAKKAIPPQS